jgi:putative MATE family efflux protein
VSEQKIDTRTARLGTAPIGRLLVRMSIPGMVSMIVMSVYNIVDTIWVSGLPNGTEAIAALTVVMPLQMVAAALGMGAGAGVTSVVSRRFGEGRVDEVSQIAGNAVVLAVLLGLPVAALCVSFPDQLALLFGGSRELVAPAVGYLTIIAWGFPLQIFGATADGLLRGSGNTKTPMYVRASAALINAILDPFLIYGWGPFPALGLPGAAIATLSAQGLGAGLTAAYLFSSRSGYKISASDLRLRLSILRSIAQVGVPSFINGCVRSTMGSMYNWVLAGFGPAAIAANGLSMRVMMLMLSFMGPGVAQALVPIVGFNFGAGNYRRMWRTWLTASLALSGIGTVLSSIIIVFAPVILAPMAHEPELLDLAVWALRLKVCTIVLVEPQMMGIFTFQGMGMGMRALALTMARNVVFVVPALLALAHLYGARGAFAAQPASDIAGVLIAGTMLWQVYRRYPVSASAPQPQ